MPEDLADTAENWPRTRSDTLVQEWIVRVRRDRLHRAGDSNDEFDRLVVEHPGAVVVLAIDRDRILVVEQYRHAVQKRLVEFPAGVLDVVGEDPLLAAQRELLEETGYVADAWQHLLDIYPSPGLSAECQHFFAASRVRLADDGSRLRLRHEEADMTVSWVRIEELREAVLAGHVRSGLTTQGILMLALLSP